MNCKYILELYILGRTRRSESAVANIKDVCSSLLNDNYDLQIIDILEYPQLAESQKIIALPTLIRVSPEPTRRIVGDLSDRLQLLSGLGLE